MRGDKELCLSSGMDDYLSKPLEPHDLLDMIAKWTLDREGDRPLTVGTTGEAATSQGEDSVCHSAEGSDVLEQAELLARCDGNKELAQRLIDVFVETVEPEYLVNLRQAIEENDAEATASVSHKLNGGAATVSATGIIAISTELNEMARQGDLSRAAELLSAIEAQVQRFQDWARGSASNL